MLKKLYNYYFDPNPTDKWGRPIQIHGPVVHRIALAYVLLSLAVTVGLYRQHNDAVVAKELATRVETISNQNRTATCRVRRNFEVSYAQTARFLADGHHIPGVSSAVLLRGMRNNQLNSEALRSVHCRYEPVPGFIPLGKP